MTSITTPKRSFRLSWVVPLVFLGCAQPRSASPGAPAAPESAAIEAWPVPPVPTAAPTAHFEADGGGAVAIVPEDPISGESAGSIWVERRFTLRASGPARGRLVLDAPWHTVGAEADGLALRERRVGGPGGARVLETEQMALAAGEERQVVVRIAGRLPPTVPPASGKEHGSTLLLLATSAARAYDLRREAELLKIVARDVLAPDAPLVVGVYDSRPELLFEGNAGDAGPSVARALAERGALGATDLEAALIWTADRARDKKVNRVVIVTDGIATAGETDSRELGLAVGRFPKDARIDWVVPGGAKDAAVLASMKAAGGAPGNVVPLHAPEAALASLLRGATVAAADPATPVEAPAWFASVAARPPAASHLPDRGAGAERVGNLAAAGRAFVPVASEEKNLDPMSADLEERPTPTRIADSTKPDQETVARVAHPVAPAAPLEAAPAQPGRLPPAAIQGIVRRNFGRFRACYIDAVRTKPGAKGRVVVSFQVQPDGTVSLAQARQSEIAHPPFVACVVRAFEALSFPESPGGAISVTYPIAFGPADGGAGEPPPASGRPDRPGALSRLPPSTEAPLEPWLGDVKLVSDAIVRGESGVAQGHAWRAWSEAPAAPLSYVMLGDALRAASRLEQAARATASIADVAPDDPAALRSAAYRAVGGAGQTKHIEDWLVRALSMSPDDLDTARAVAELRALRGDIDSSLLILDGLLTKPGAPQTASAREILRADISLFAVALAAREPARRIELERWASAVGVTFTDRAIFRASVLSADPRADLDLVLSDMTEARATRASPNLATGGRLVAMSTGSGPEAFLSDGRRAYPYDVDLVLASRGGAYTTGAVDVLEHDGRGGLSVVGMPFVIQVEKGQVRAGRLEESVP